jgi:hypothetical protein
MDCHLEKTNWQLLGVFKIHEVNTWMEQLFKHEGVCVMGEDNFEFMSKMREEIPHECKGSNYKDSSGNQLYYSSKPLPEGDLTIGLYKDEKCSVPYTGTDMNAFDVAGVSEEYMKKFMDELSVWKICQPCVAYDLAYADEEFVCNDKAGYKNCNQVRS